MDFDEFQKQARSTKFFTVQSDELTRHYLLAGLTAQVGEIANRLKKKLRDGGDYIMLRDEISERIGYSLWYLAMLADQLELPLDEIAKENVAFNNRRWRQVANVQSDLLEGDFDSEYPLNERLPERLIIHFETQLDSGPKKTVVTFYPNWPSREPSGQFGNSIDDNSPIEDHYRYHDIFHFAYVTFLGWSPVVRGLLQRKRKSNPDVDREQDGARARDTEEAATAFIYSYVSQQSFLETSTNIDTGLLTTVRTLLRAYEVKARAEKEWEAAILAAAEILRKLVSNEGGWVEVNQKDKVLRYLGKEPPS